MAITTATKSETTTFKTSTITAPSIDTTTRAVSTTETTKRVPVTTETTPGETVTSCTEIDQIITVETLTHAVEETTPKTERSDIDFVPTHKSGTDATIFGKPTEVSIIQPKQESGTSKDGTVATSVNTAKIRGATPIAEPITDGATKSITNRITTSIIIAENKASTKAGSESALRTTATITETITAIADFANINTEGIMAPGTVPKNLKTVQTEPSNDETREATTARPKESTQAKTTSYSPTTINGATNIKHPSMTAITTGTKEITDGKQLTGKSTLFTKTTIKSNRFTSFRSPSLLTTTLNGLSTNTISPERLSTKAFHKLTMQSHKSLSPCTGKCQTKSTTMNPAGKHGQGKVPMTTDKTFYSAITMGTILVLCALLALIVFIKDLVRN
ncbi:mucin-5AC-like [Myxocyprinus asiaticus]|uniref:mucin-5AC-like n=1 Tax=Myxocyprinus asiaticus TaxID=70543 RepID=UPI0022235C88|nr:mucin-5AC-like [Myxocyprinus asiaticus]